METRLRQEYETAAKAALQSEFNYANPMQVPRLDKVVINMGLGEAVSDSKRVKTAVDELALIAGQKPVVTKAKKSIAGFKLR